jgi:hypothetical protein
MQNEEEEDSGDIRRSRHDRLAMVVMMIGLLRTCG